LAITFRCVRVAPFDTPVVPPVYCRKAMSVFFSWAGWKGILPPCASASLKRTLLGSE
jgi:hypothetical protein